MDFSAANTSLWNIVIQLGIIAAVILAANFLRRKISFIRKTLLPIPVFAGFILLILRYTLLRDILDIKLMEKITYHGLALGFIAMSLRIPPENKEEKGSLTALKSGAMISSTYLVQAFFALIISLVTAYTFKPDFFKSAGILLPMAYGMGPGQANNIGSAYEALGFAGGRSFGLSLAAAGYICACVVGVIYINILVKKNKLKRADAKELSDSAAIGLFRDKGEIPISESVDKLSIQVALIIIVYLLTYLLSWGLDALFKVISPELSAMLSPVLWGFNFIIGVVLAILMRMALKGLRKTKLMTRQYQNNYLLSRISGFVFDLMIVAAIASIDIEDVSANWIPFVLMAVVGAVVTFIHVRRICRRLYPKYTEENFIAMYGMLTGTISSGVLLLRELDPDFRTTAANNLLLGCSFDIVFSAPLLLLVGMAPKSTLMTFLVMGILIVYYLLLLLFIFKIKGKRGKQSCDNKPAPENQIEK